MIQHLPVFISLVFGLTTALTVWLFFKAAKNSALALIIILLWLGVQGAIGYSGFYTHTDSIPPRFILLILPALLTILFLFVTPSGKIFINNLDAKWMTYLHIVRVPVEMVLFSLFLQKQVPQLMTFEGRNFDILSGLSAPLIAYFGYNQRKLGKPALLLWNFICLGLLFNIVINAVLSAPFPFQQFAFDQPNVAVLYFPFVWLPGFIVPVVLLCHLASVRKLLLHKN